MNSDELVELFKLVHEIFPLPAATKCNHGFHLADGKLVLTLIVGESGKEMFQPVEFDSESIDRKELENIKRQLDERDNEKVST